MTSERAEFIREVPLFAGLPDDAVAEIAERAEETRVVAGDWLFREGEVGDRLFVLRAGRLEVLREVDGEEIPIRNLSPGAVLGELAVLTDAPRSASVRARRDSGLLGLSSDAFFELLDDVDFARALTRVLANQLQASRAVTVENDPVPPVIAVVPLAGEVPSDAFAGELARAMAAGGDVKCLTEKEASEAESFGDVLDRWERAGDQVVLSVESPADSAWRSFCLRQADRVVTTADAGTPNGPPAAPSGSDLALLGWPGSRPVLRGLMAALEPRAVYHVADGDGRGASAALVARRLSGASPGIVLSGGGARGLAHLGVLDELQKAGMTIDRVGGCSMGAIIGGLFASGLEVDEIEARLRAEFVDRNPISDYTIPLTALTRGRKGEAMLWRLYGDRRIEELEREFFCVSCDLVTSELVIHREGELAVGVGASGCLPGVIPPYSLDGQLLVDGGIRDNLPVATMAARGEGPVLAVDVSSRFEPPTRAVAGGRPGLRRLSERARRAVVGWDEPRPSFPETLTRVVVLGSIDTAEAAQEHADAVIAPEVQGIGLVEFDRIAEIRERGAAAARGALDDGLATTLFGAAALGVAA